MKKILDLFKRNAGFTLIELLVVIGILGILAAALIATIDPFEQIKKASDANVKNTTVEFVNASIRYYTTHNLLPWTDQVNAPSCYGTGVTPSGESLSTARMGACLTALINDGELKSGFTSVTSIINSIFATGAATGEGATACFRAQSKSQQRDPNTKYAINGALTTGCASQGGTTTTCYWCAQ